MDAVKEFRDRATNPDHPTTKGTLQNSDIYFQQQEVQNKYYEALPDIVEDYMEKFPLSRAGNTILQILRRSRRRPHDCRYGFLDGRYRRNGRFPQQTR